MSAVMTARQLQTLQMALTDGASVSQINILARQLWLTANESEFVARVFACLALAGPAGDDITMSIDERLAWVEQAENIARSAVQSGQLETATPLLARSRLLHADILRGTGDFEGALYKAVGAHVVSRKVTDNYDLWVRTNVILGRIELSLAQADAEGLLETPTGFQRAYDQLADVDPESMTPEQTNLWAIVLCHHAFAQHLAGDPYVADAVMHMFRAAALRTAHPQIRRASDDLGPLLWGNRPDGQYMSDDEFLEFMLRELYHP